MTSEEIPLSDLNCCGSLLHRGITAGNLGAMKRVEAQKPRRKN
jgi:hypothetical protein